MKFVWIGLCVLLFLAAIVLLIAYLCFRMAFFVPKKRPVEKEEYPIPDGDEYLPYRDQMIAWIKEVRSLPHEDIEASGPLL